VFWSGFYSVLQCFYRDRTRRFHKVSARFLQGLHGVLTMCVTRFLQGVCRSASSVAARHKPPRAQVRLPAGASHLITPRIKAILTIIFHEARAVLGIEPRTTRTRSENHTTRPNSQLKITGPSTLSTSTVAVDAPRCVIVNPGTQLSYRGSKDR
jgi:hypothetical protein